MEPITIGQRVQVIDARLVHYKQVGTVMAIHADGGYYVHLDYDTDQADSSVLFPSAALEAAPNAPPWAPHRRHWSADADLDRHPETGGRA